MAKITGVLLAAGASQRYGANKLTETLEDEELVLHSVRALEPCDRIIAVVRKGANELQALEHGQNIPKRKATTTQRNRKREKPASRDPGPVQTKATSVQFAALTPDPTQGAKEKVSYLRPVKPDSVVQNVNKDIVSHAEKIITLYTAKKLPSLAQKRIITALREYFDISVGSSTAREIQKLVKDLITQPNSTAEQPHKLIVTTD